MHEDLALCEEAVDGLGGRRHEKFKKMFGFLQDRENDQGTFTLDDLADTTGYKMSSIRTYYGKRLKGLLVIEKDEQEGIFCAQGMSGFSESSFIDYMTQRSSPADVAVAAVQAELPDEPASKDEVVAGLIERSASSFKVALEVYHREGMSAQVMACCGLMCDAWRMLFDAETARIRGIEQLGDVSIISPHRGLQDILGRFFPNPRDPVRRNLEWLIHLHDAASHLLVPESKPYLSRLFQASALNFRRRWEAVAGRWLFSSGAGMLAMGMDGELGELEALEGTYGEHIVRRLGALVSALHAEEDELGSESFCSDPALRLVLTPRREGSDLLMSAHQATARAREQVAPEAAYPYSAVEVVHEINKQLPYATRLSSAAVEVIDAQHDVRATARNVYYARLEDPLRHRYSEAYVAWITGAIQEDEGWLERVRRSYERERR